MLSKFLNQVKLWRAQQVDSSNQMTQQSPTQAAPSSAPNPMPNPVPTAPQPPPNSPDNRGNKLIFWLIGGVVLIALIAGGIFWYMSKQQSVTEFPATQTTTTQKQPTITELVDALDKELSSIEVQAADSDISSIDADLQNL